MGFSVEIWSQSSCDGAHVWVRSNMSTKVLAVVRLYITKLHLPLMD